jgi:poly(A) polymerase
MPLPEARILPRAEHCISRQDIDQDALKVLNRLHRYGFKAYLVGGGVRDLLLGRRPKDYDIGTNATPVEVLELFRNSRVIGRRFPIVHVLFSQKKFIEIATFRSLEEDKDSSDGLPTDSDSLEEKERLLEEADSLLDENSEVIEQLPVRKRKRPSPLEIAATQHYGTPAEDALRRDLTINGLFYSIDDFSVIDYVGGLEDLKAGVVRSIGDPMRRFEEDSVRMLRAVRHAARIGFKIEAETLTAIKHHRKLLGECNRARLIEEFYRDLRGGASVATLKLLKETGLLSELLPELETLLPEEDVDPMTWKRLAVLDRDIIEGKEIGNPVLLALLLAFPMIEQIKRDKNSKDRRVDYGRAVYRFLKPLTSKLGVSRRDTEQLFLIVISQRRMRSFLDGGAIPRFLKSKAYFDDAFRLLAMDAEARGISLPDLRFTLGNQRRRSGRRRRNGRRRRS